jgi:hypothetical protein
MANPDNIFSSNALDIEADKADHIRFIAGKYSGKTGWLRHSRRRRGTLYFYVLVDNGDGTVLKTYAEIDNIGPAELEEPTSYATALLQQHIDIEATMNTLARQLATCSIQDGNTQGEISLIFTKKLHDAIIKQEKKGPKARYRIVDFDEDL